MTTPDFVFDLSDEATKELRKLFHQIDLNSDGQITWLEMRKSLKSRGNLSLFFQLDKKLNELFNQLDLNKGSVPPPTLTPWWFHWFFFVVWVFFFFFFFSFSKESNNRKKRRKGLYSNHWLRMRLCTPPSPVISHRRGNYLRRIRSPFLPRRLWRIRWPG